MPIYNAPLADMKFILNDVFNAEQFWQSNENLAHLDAATAEAILEEMAKFAQNVTLPLNRTGDEEGATYNNGAVTTPAGFKDAFQQYAQGGWIGLGAEEEWGGRKAAPSWSCRWAVGLRPRAGAARSAGCRRCGNTPARPAYRCGTAA